MREGPDWPRILYRLKDITRTNQAGLAKLIGVSQSQLSRWLSGQDEPTKLKNVATITELAQQHNISIEMAPVPRHNIAIIGTLHGTVAIVTFYQQNNPVEYAPMVDDSTVDTVALVIEGNALAPLEDGWLCYYNDSRTPPGPATVGQFCVVRLKNGRTLARRVEWGSPPGELWNLRTFGGLPMLGEANVEIEWAEPIFAYRARRKN